MALVSKDGQNFYDLAPDINTDTGEDKNLSGAIAKGYQQYVTVTKNGQDYYNLPATQENIAGLPQKGYMLADQYDAMQQSQQDLQNKTSQAFSGTSGALAAAGKGLSDFASFGLGDIVPAAMGAGSTAVNKLLGGQDLSSTASAALKDYSTLKAANKQAGDIAWKQQPVAYGLGAAAAIAPTLGSTATAGALGGADLASRVAQGGVIGAAQGLGQGDASLASGDVSGTLKDVAMGGALGGLIPSVAEGVVAPAAKTVGSGLAAGAQKIADLIPSGLTAKILGTTQEAVDLGKANPILRAQLSTPEGSDLVKQTMLEAQKAVQSSGKDLSQDLISKFQNAAQIDKAGWSSFDNLLSSKTDKADPKLTTSITDIIQNAKDQLSTNLDSNLAKNYSAKLDQLAGKISTSPDIGTQFKNIMDVKKELSGYVPQQMQGLLPSERDAANVIKSVVKGINGSLGDVADNQIATAYTQRNLESSAFQSLRDMMQKKFSVATSQTGPVLGAVKGSKAISNQDINPELQKRIGNLSDALSQTNPDMSAQLSQQVDKLKSMQNMVGASKQAQPLLSNYSDMLAAQGQTANADVVSKLAKMFPTSGSTEDLSSALVPKLGWMGKAYKLGTDAIGAMGSDVPKPQSLSDLVVGKGDQGFSLPNIAKTFSDATVGNPKIQGSPLWQAIKATGETQATDVGVKTMDQSQQQNPSELFKAYALNQSQKTSILQQNNISQSVLKSAGDSLSPQLRARLQVMSTLQPDQQSKEMYLIQQDPRLGPEMRKIINKDQGVSKSTSEPYFN